MPPEAPKLISYNKFKASVKTGKRWPADFAAVRYLLKAWHKSGYKANAAAQKKDLAELSAQCLVLLGKTGAEQLKDHESRAARSLLSDVLHGLAHADYFERKARGLAAAQTGGLHKAYAHERAHFKEQKDYKRADTNPASASWLSDQLRQVRGELKKSSPTVDPEVAALAKKNFEDLSYSEYMKLHRKLGGPDARSSVCKQLVHFARREERIRDLMLVPADGALYDTGARLIEGMRLYAMDRFGNLFAAHLPGSKDSRYTGEQVNHSTMCAGREVICAGEFEAKRGQIIFITNNSGHYKPSAARLLSTIDILIKEYGLKLDTTLTEISDQESSGKFKGGSAVKDFRGHVSSLGKLAPTS